MRYPILCVLMLGLAACVQERSGVTTSEIPAPVLRTLERGTPGKIDSIVREKKDGRVTYRAKITSGEKGWEVVVDEAGQLVSKKERK